MARDALGISGGAQVHEVEEVRRQLRDLRADHRRLLERFERLLDLLAERDYISADELP